MRSSPLPGRFTPGEREPIFIVQDSGCFPRPLWRDMKKKNFFSYIGVSGFGGLSVSMLASGTRFRWFKPGRSRRVFRAKKHPQYAFLWRGTKAVGPMSYFAWKSSFRLNYRTVFSPIVPPFAARISRVLQTWRYLAAKVGMSKGGATYP